MKKFSFALNTRNKTPKSQRGEPRTSSWQLLSSPLNVVKCTSCVTFVISWTCFKIRVSLFLFLVAADARNDS